MTKLSDTQRVILSAASQRTDRIALPLPKSLKGGAAHKVINALIEKGLLKEVKVNRPGSDPVWRGADTGSPVTLVITDSGLQAIGVEVPTAKPRQVKEAMPSAPAAKASPPEPKKRKPREGTKQSLMIELLRRPQGATIGDIVEATGWQSHTVRGAMAGALKKKLGLTIASVKDEVRGRVYHLA